MKTKAEEVFRKYKSKKPLRITHETYDNSNFVKKRLQLIPSEDFKQALQELEKEMLDDEYTSLLALDSALDNPHDYDGRLLLSRRIKELKDKING